MLLIRLSKHKYKLTKQLTSQRTKRQQFNPSKMYKRAIETGKYHAPTASHQTHHTTPHGAVRASNLTSLAHPRQMAGKQINHFIHKV